VDRLLVLDSEEDYCASGKGWIKRVREEQKLEVSPESKRRKANPVMKKCQRRDTLLPVAANLLEDFVLRGRAKALIAKVKL
jgi:hypothetical protein